MANCVIDASVVLAFVFGESGAEIAEGAMADGVLSTVNLAEVATKLLERGVDLHEVEAQLTRPPFSVAEFDSRQALAAAALRSATKAAGLSLGDRACLALGQALDLPVITADRAWLQVADAAGVEVRLLRGEA